MSNYPVPMKNSQKLGNKLLNAPTIPPSPPYEDGFVIRDISCLEKDHCYMLKRQGDSYTTLPGKCIDEAATDIELLRYKGRRGNTGIFVLEWENPNKENFGINKGSDIGSYVKRELTQIGATYQMDKDMGAIWNDDFYLVGNSIMLGPK